MIQKSVEAAFFRPVTSIVNVWLPLAKPVAVKTVFWGASVGEYVSTSSTKTPSRTTRAIPPTGPLPPIQLIDVPVKVNEACAPGDADSAAGPAPHALLAFSAPP